MTSPSRALTCTYAAVSLADILLAGRARARLRRVTKPALMPLLAARLRAEAANSVNSGKSMAGVPAGVLGGVLISGLGDIALLGTAPRKFLLGLGSFAVGHGAYIMTLTHLGAWGRLRKRWGWGVVAGAATGVIAATVARRAGPLRVPVIAYGGLITTMAALASATGSPRAAAGAWLFCLSDLVLVVEKFSGEALPQADAIVMATYTAGQYALTTGLLRECAHPASANRR